MKKDYVEFRGKEVKFIDVDGAEYAGKVVDCHYDIGVTIVEEGSGEYLHCTSSPWRHKAMCGMDANANANDCDTYDFTFYMFIAMIHVGVVDFAIIKDACICSSSNDAEADTCAFN